MPCGLSARSAVWRLPAWAGSGKRNPRRDSQPPCHCVRACRHASSSSIATSPWRRGAAGATATGRRRPPPKRRPAREERRHDADRARADDQHGPVAERLAEQHHLAPNVSASACRIPLAAIGPICATKTPRIGSSPFGSGTRTFARRVGCMSTLVTEGRGDDLSGREACAPAFGDAGDFHVAEERHRVSRCSPSRHEHAAVGIPARMEIRIGVLQEGQLGAGRETCVEGFEPHMAFRRRPLHVVVDVGMPSRSTPRDGCACSTWCPQPAVERSIGRPSRTESAIASATRCVFSASP